VTRSSEQKEIMAMMIRWRSNPGGMPFVVRERWCWKPRHANASGAGLMRRNHKIAVSFASAAIIASGLAFPPAARAMSYSLARADFSKGCHQSVETCPFVIVASGEIGERSGEEFLAFLLHNKDRRIGNAVFLNSPGGSLLGALKLGIVMRKLKVTAYIGQVATHGEETIATSGVCASACVFAMMGGTKRFVLPTCLIGIHRASVPGSLGDGVMAVLLGQRRMPQDGVSALRKYVSRMGVDASIVDMSEKISPTAIRKLKPDEIVRLHLAQIAS